jgi:hypothetical protein
VLGTVTVMVCVEFDEEELNIVLYTPELDENIKLELIV